MKLLITFSIFILSLNSFATDSNSVQAINGQAPTYPSLNDVRCEKLSGHSLADFKAKLVENCDLNKPYSSSMSKLLNEETYFYCCQIKK